MRPGGSTRRWRIARHAAAATVMLAASAPAAGAAPTTFAGLDPLSLLTTNPPLSCGLEDDPAREVDKEVGSFEELGVYQGALVVLTPRPVLTMCDPARRTARQPGLAFSGTLLDERPMQDSVSHGFRQLSAALISGDESDDAKVTPERGGGLVPGDRITLPPASPESTLAVTMLTGTAARTVTFERWADPAQVTTLTIEGDATSRAAVLQRADGTRREQRVPLVALPAPQFAVRASGRLLRIEARGFPSGAVWAEIAPSSDDGASTSVQADGPTTVRLRSGKRAPRSFALAWSDLDGRRFLAYDCRLTGAGTSLRIRSCQRTQRADGAAFDAAPVAVAAARARRAAWRGAPSPRTSAQLSRTPRRPFASATAGAPRVAVQLRRLGVPEASMPIGDLTGDGRAEFTDETLWLSGARRSTALTGRPFVVPTGIVGDLNLDAHPELLLQNGTVVLSDGPWAAPTFPTFRDGELSGPRTIGLRQPERGRDSDISGIGSDAVGPLADVTGDGRPEAAVVSGDGAVVVPSELLRGGSDHLVPSLAFHGSDPLPGSAGDTAEVPTAPLAVAGGLYRLAVASEPTRAKDQSTVAIERLDARGQIAWRSPPLTLPGPVGLSDRDPISGDLLLIGSTSACNSDTTDSRTCFGRVFRIRADGTLRSSARLPSSDSTQEPMFGPDGPDPDALPDVVLPTWPTTLMPSTATGTLGRRDLPVLTVQGRPLNANWRSDRLSPGQTYRAFPVEVRVRGRIGMPWRGLTFAAR